jgi:uncharacterized membrane protein
MKELLMHATSWDMSPEELQRQITQGDSGDMKRRRAIVGVSLVGMAAMGIVALLQTGVVKKLPDPPVDTPNFDTEKVNLSEEAFSYGMPDAPLVLVTHAINVAIASAGPPDCHQNRRWLPLAAVAMALPQAAIAAKYLFYQMPKVDNAWCPYCVVDALTHFATVALTLPEAAKALGFGGIPSNGRQVLA